MSALGVAFVALAAIAQATPQSQELRGPQKGVSSYPTPVFDENGRLWLAFNQGEHVYVTSSDDLGQNFAPAVAVNPTPERIDANGEGRPKIAVGSDGTLFVTWTKKLEEPYTGLIRFSRSTDGGKSFSTPMTLNDDGIVTGHRFDALAVAPSGEVFVAWIDKRDLERALAEGHAYAGAAIYTAVSVDGGKSFGPNRKLNDQVCECCRLSFAFNTKGEAALLFRDLLDTGIRDHSLAKGVGKPGASVHRVTFDDWKIEACPHHGPSLAIDSAGNHHIAWFTAGERSGTGAFYARSDNEGESFGTPLPLGDGERATHPFLLTVSGTIYLTWMEVDGKGSLVRVQTSKDGGRTWSIPVTVAKAAPGADHPLLVRNGQEVFLSWFAKDIGYRLIPISGERN